MPDGGFNADLRACIETAARKLLGEPNRALSSKDELRFGTHGSLSVCIGGDKRGTWYDHEAGEGGGVIDLVCRFERVDRQEAIEWLRREAGLPQDAPNESAPRGHIVATYPYTDEDGAVLFEVVRFEPKAFRQRKPMVVGWTWNVQGVRQVPFHLPAVLGAAPDTTIFIPEGEKDVLALEALGLVATCNPGGAKKWPASFAPHFAGRHVVILPDNDEAGREHAQIVAARLQGSAASIRVLALPDLPPKGDVSDWIAAGGTAAHLAELAGGEVPQEKPEAPERGEIELTEDGVAIRFAEQHGHEFRYCHDTGKWFVWTGTHWQMNRDRLAFQAARELVRALNRGTDFKTRAVTGKVSFAGGVETYAQRDRVFAVTSEIWDTNNTLLGTPGGTVDLVTGKVRPSRQEDYITRVTAVAPAETADCPTWLAFLKQATADDHALIRFLQQWCGYCLTGSTREHALLFIYGPGGNGKSVFLNTVAGILAQYCTTAPMDTFTSSTGDRHPTDVAMLRGARLVSATETEEGRAWAEAKIKQMTGGDKISARFMRQDFFSFTPNFKLTIAGNHKPALRNVDEAARRRFNIVPFLHKPAQPDRQLEAKLKREWPGILRWMIEGCLDWQDAGLVRPAIVAEATDEYFESQDVIGRWMAERCILVTHLVEKPGNLASDCREWAMKNGEAVPTPAQVRSALEKVGGVRFVKVKGDRKVQGIGLRPPVSQTRGGEGA